jgi:hypothetical protein
MFSSRFRRQLLSFFCAFTLLTLLGCHKNLVSEKRQVISFNEFSALETQGRVGFVTTDSPDCSSKPLEGLNENLSCKDLRREFRYVVYVGKQIYVYWDMKKSETGIDYDKWAVELESKITDKMSLQQYFRDVLRLWAASLHDGHVNAMTGDDLSKLDLVTTNIRLRVFAPGTDHEKVVVANSKVPQVPVKSEILKINGESVTTVMDRFEKLSSGSTKAMRRLSAGALLLDRIGVENASDPLSIEVQVPGEAAARTVALDRVIELNLPPDIAETTEAKEPTGEDKVQARILPEQIGYLKIDGFVGTRLPAIFDRLMSQLRNTKGLIIDLRANGGGDLSGNHVLRWLTLREIVRFRISPTTADFLLSQRPEYFLMPSGSEPGFFDWTDKTIKPTSPSEGSYANKPVVALIGPRCFSACDTFSAALKANGLAKFIGENTAGGTGTPLVFDLPVSEFKFRYSVVRGKTANGAWIEGQGTAPDVPLEYSVSDLAVEPYADSQASKAIEILRTSRGDAAPIPASAAGGLSGGSAGVSLTRPQEIDADISALKLEFIDLQLSERFHE